MSIQSIELVKKAIEFKKPERIPLDFLPPRYSDFCWVSGGSMVDPAGKRTSIYHTDEWGCTWKRIDKSMGRPFKYPLKNWKDVRDFRFPNPLGPEKREVAKQTIAENQGKFIIGLDPCMGMWERAKALIGTEEFLVGLYTQTEHVCELLDRLVNFQVKIINKWNELGVHGFMTGDDWGTQETLWIKPQIWRRIFKPRYKKIAKVLHSYEMYYLFHSCGYILDIIRDLIEIGVDVLHLAQPELMGVEKLGSHFGGQVCFYSPVDIQTIMLTGSLEEIRESAKKMIKCLGSFNGGFMACEYADPESLNITQEKIEAEYQAFKKYGIYKPGKKGELCSKYQ